MSQQPDSVWTEEYVRALAPDAASVPAARTILRRGGFGGVEPTADGRGWWVLCRGLTDSYQVTVRRAGDRFDCECNCPSYKNPCKHALALLFYLVEHPELRTEAEAPQATAGDFESLLRAVFAAPEDDTPRLVFADFLDENNQTDRAALIRLQCEQARLRANSNRYKELARRIDKLVPKVRKQTGVFPYAHRHTGMRYTFRRGFLHLDGRFERLDLDAAPARFVNLFRDGWVESVRASLSGDHGDRTAGWGPLLAHVAELDVSASTLDEDGLLDLVAATSAARATGRLVRIKVHKRSQAALDRLIRVDRGETVEDIPALEEGRYFYALTPSVFGLLARAGRLNGARLLGLGCSSEAAASALGDADVPALLAADLSRLERLDLYDWDLSAAGTIALVRGLSQPAIPLRDLSCQRCRVEFALGIRRVQNGELSVEVSRNRWANDGLFEGLIGCAVLQRVAAFASTGIGASADNVAALAAAFDPAKLKQLSISYDPIGNGVAAFVSAFSSFELRELVLGGCQLGAKGIAALAGSPLVASLEKLDLSQNAPGKGGVQTLLKMHAPALKELVLVGCALAPPEKKQLQKQFGSKVRF